MGAIEVVLDAPTIAAALSQIGSAAIRFPEVPPLTGIDATDALGVFAYVGDQYFAHILTDELIKEVSQVLTDVLGWEFEETRSGLSLVYDQAQDSGGGLVRPERGVSVPANLLDPTRTALRAAAAGDLGFPRVVVTSDPSALRIEELQPHGIAFPKDEAIRFRSPRSFARFAAEVRQAKRHVPPGRS